MLAAIQRRFFSRPPWSATIGRRATFSATRASVIEGFCTEGLAIFVVGVTILVFTALWIAGKS